MPKEKRRAPRFRIDQMIEMSFGREQVLRCRGVDLSEIGLRCRTDLALETGTRVFLLLSLGEGDEPVKCEGVVAWSSSTESGFEAGVALGDTDPAIRQRIRAYLVRRPRA